MSLILSAAGGISGQRLQRDRRRGGIEADGAGTARIVGREKLPAAHPHRQHVGLNVLGAADERVVEGRAGGAEHIFRCCRQRRCALEQLGAVGGDLLDDGDELGEILARGDKLAARRLIDLRLVRRGLRRLGEKRRRPVGVVGEFLGDRVVGGDLVAQADPAHRLGEAADLEAAGDIVGGGDEPVDLAADRGELPDRRRRDDDAENDHRRKADMNARADAIVAQPHRTIVEAHWIIPGKVIKFYAA